MTGASQLLESYVRALDSHDWEQVRPMVDDNAVFIFSEGTYVGIAAIGEAICRTFAHITNEKYEVVNKRWAHATDSMALCYYDFEWRGQIDGRKASGSGRGTSVLQKTPLGWKIVHEHLGPPAHA